MTVSKLRRARRRRLWEGLIAVGILALYIGVTLYLLFLV